MGRLIDGVWHDQRYDTKKTGGRFVRSESQFRDWISADGSSGFRAEVGRYHLYVALSCPWAHRTVIMRALKGLEDAVGLSVVDILMLEEGWVFSEAPGCIPDTVNGFSRLHEVYTKADPGYTGRVTVPVLWDKERSTIVNNESSEIIRMFNSAFAGTGAGAAGGEDYYPVELRADIDAINETVYDTVNNGVYKAGFATGQEAYEAAYDALFTTFDELETSLGRQRYLVGPSITEADWRAFTTLVRFDAVYHYHFKCNRRRLIDYPNLWGYTRELYQVPGVAETVNMEHIKGHYYMSHTSVNPTQVVPKGPDTDFTEPHGRDGI
ncbi:MAG: glutathione S-transferase family protein [Rhodospirillales bacterium]|nr:glutathione S-transferase family protein [Rhodospirillales bacterium]